MYKKRECLGNQKKLFEYKQGGFPCSVKYYASWKCRKEAHKTSKLQRFSHVVAKSMKVVCPMNAFKGPKLVVDSDDPRFDVSKVSGQEESLHQE